MTITKLDYTVSTKNSSVPNPPGYQAPVTGKQLAHSRTKKPDADSLAKQAQKSTELKMKRAWDLAMSPAKSLPMQGIMLYFSGSGIQIFSLGMIFMLLTQPLSAVFNIFRAFEALRPTPQPTVSQKATDVAEEPSYAPLTGPMILYVLCQGLVLALGLYKCWAMGILPTGSGDWLQFETRSNPPEWSAVRAMLLG
ncbi:endoplasmic reticulum protein [Cryptococcus wingfieldii CBS 7118]|uniref:ER membrane protein complex subunit 4 n=1 Tax=Cryptococcus wingfieldii CBS 7118 TaxID=1295528 RepID=A0A1E3K986_9TREE|nr:endoplasmic reticulum protein [Cryptococcus wingfieldii CBS 7118]ODO08812.1 endoplasmic reticulum protein [Cryptococcus wingfieldii CBS 7118]